MNRYPNLKIWDTSVNYMACLEFTCVYSGSRPVYIVLLPELSGYTDEYYKYTMRQNEFKKRKKHFLAKAGSEPVTSRASPEGAFNCSATLLS